MSFINSLKRSLGLATDDESYDERLFSDTAEAIEPPKPQASNVAAIGEAPEPVSFDPAMQDRLFEQVLKIFNESLPPFVAASVDRKAQVEYLRNALDSGIKAYLAELGTRAEEYCEARWRQTRDSMSAELDAIKAKAGEVEKKSADIQQKQLSADRQRRALSDRVHDLEAQVVKLEAEREQYELENRSLVNRIKVAGVQQEDVESARAMIDQLQRENKQLREQPGNQSAAEADALRIQIEEMSGGMDSLKEQARVATDMLEDMRKSLASANKKLAERDKQLHEARTLIEQGNEAMEQKMLEVDMVIKQHTDTIKTQKAKIEERDSQIDSLKATIADNLLKQARRERELQDTIDSLRTDVPPVKTGAATIVLDDEPEPASAPVISDDDLSDIEKTFESEEWFTASPPADTPSMRADDDESFGYQEPSRPKNTPKNPSQLSLF